MLLSELLSFRLSSFVGCFQWPLILLPEPRAAPGDPGFTGADLCFSNFFLNRFFDGLFMVLALILDDLFDDFPMFFASLFRYLFFMCF